MLVVHLMPWSLRTTISSRSGQTTGSLTSYLVTETLAQHVYRIDHSELDAPKAQGEVKDQCAANWEHFLCLHSF